MKVKELMEKLQKVDPEMEVAVDCTPMLIKARSVFIGENKLCVSTTPYDCLRSVWEAVE